MVRPSTSALHAPHRHAAFGVVLLVLALLLAQMLGLAHRVLHGTPASLSHASVQVQAPGLAVTDLLTHLLTPQGESPDCQLYDHLGQPDALVALPPALPALVPPLLRSVLPWACRALAAPAVYAARAPPALR